LGFRKAVGVKVNDEAPVLFEKLQKNSQDLCVFRADVNVDNKSLSVWEAAYDPETEKFLIKSPDELFPASKESLISLLETAEELGCGHATMVLERSHPNFKELVCAFGYLGFAMSQSDQVADDCLFLRYDFD
jgi:hypothetical protein